MAFCCRNAITPIAVTVTTDAAIANTKLGIKGAFDMDSNGSKETIDPVSVKADANGPRVTAGMRLKLAVFTFHGDYTIQKYSALTVGFGIAVR